MGLIIAKKSKKFGNRVFVPYKKSTKAGDNVHIREKVENRSSVLALKLSCKAL